MSRLWDLLRKAERESAALEDAEPNAGTVVAEPPTRLSQVPTATVIVRPETRIAAHTDPRSPAADSLRFLRLRLNQVWNPEKLKKLLITSPMPHDGKSTLALNLAVALTEEGKRTVLLIEGDLHRATVSKELGLSDYSGVAEVLEDGADAFSLVRRVLPLGFYFLPAGAAKGNPSELLQTGALPAMMESLSHHFDWILVDSPPVAPLTDTLSWKEQSDATLLVTRAGKTPIQSVEDGLNLIGRKHVLAIVLNAAEGVDRLYEKYYKTYTSKASKSK